MKQIGPLLIIIALLVLPTAYGANSATIKLTKPLNISRNSSTSVYQDVFALDKFVYVAWMDGDDTTGQFDIYFKASHNHGKSFGHPVKLSNGEGRNLLPKIAAFDNNVYVVWSHEGGFDYGAKFRASHDNGKHFDPLIDFGSDNSFTGHGIAAFDDNVYLVLARYSTSGSEAVIRVSHDSGVTFGAPLVYGKSLCGVGELNVAAWKNHVYVANQEPCEDHPDLEFRASHDSGDTFSRPVYIGDESQQISIVAKDKFVYVVWNENTEDVNFRASSDNGRTFGPIQTLEGDLDSVSNPTPHIAISEGSDVYVTWTSNLFTRVPNGTLSFEDELDDVRTHLFFTASHDDGQHFGPLLRFDSRPDYSINARIAANGEKVFVVWTNVSATYVPSGTDLFLKVSNNRGESFGDTIAIKDDLGNPINEVRPDIDTSDDRVYVSWWQSKEPESPSDIFIQSDRLT